MGQLRISLALVALALGATSCGLSDETAIQPEPTTTVENGITTSAESTTTLEVPSTVDGDELDGTVEGPTTDGSDDIDQATVTEPNSNNNLPGEAVDLFSIANQELTVVGVDFDDSLNVRAIPELSADVVATAGPAATLSATGRTRYNDDLFWYEVSTSNQVGWVVVNYVAMAGYTDDATAEVIESIGQTPQGATMEELGTEISKLYASDDPPSRIVQSGPTRNAETAEVTYDIIGLGDDGLAGLRLHVFATEGSGGYELKSVERTILCSRGVSAEGLCA